MLPSFQDISPNLKDLLDVNLARNELFNGEQVFGVSKCVSEFLTYLFFVGVNAVPQ